MKSSLRLIVCIAVILGVAVTMPAYGRTRLSRTVARNQTSAARVAQWLLQSRLNYRKTGEDTWVINYPGKATSNLQILVASGSDFVVLGVVVAVKKDMRVTSDLMFKLLRLSHSVDYVKIGFDDDEDLFVRTEVKTKLLDAQEFKSNVEIVAAAAERVHSEIGSFLVTP